MKTAWGDPIQYFMDMELGFLHINQLLGKQVKLNYEGTRCLSCSAAKPLFRQGFCRSCFFETPATGEWIMRPELSKAHLDEEDRDLDYEKKMQLQPHIVYLALSSHLKVGVTRKRQVPTRWIDQGAHQAVPLLETPNRYLAGVGEVHLKDHFSDKTNWRKMLQNSSEPVQWEDAIPKAIDALPKDLKPYIVKQPTVTDLSFPVLSYPEKVKSLNLEKEQGYAGLLTGIKGQYLLFEDQTVFNVRANEGTVVTVTIG